MTFMMLQVCSYISMSIILLKTKTKVEKTVNHYFIDYAVIYRTMEQKRTVACYQTR